MTEERLGHLFAVAKESYDVVVVDTPPFFHGPVLSTLDRTDQLLLVASLDVPAIKNIKLTLQTLDLLHYPKERRHLLLNRTGSKVGLRPGEVERALDMKVEFEVPSERDVPVSINRGVPIALANPRAGVVKSLGEIADKLVPDADPVDRREEEAQAARKVGRRCRCIPGSRSRASPTSPRRPRPRRPPSAPPSSPTRSPS